MGLIKGFEYIGLVKMIDNLTKDEQDSFQNVLTGFIDTADKYVAKYDELFSGKQKQFNELDKTIKEELATQKQEMNELKKLYEEKLRFSEPANYWQKLNKDYANSAKLWMVFSILLTVISVGILMCLLYYLPNIDNNNWFLIFRTTAFITTIITMFAFAIKMMTKMMFSSYHLSRDAKEREQLTYFYLSLMNEKAVTEQERELIMKSLFSRADTGLLKGDSTPEMPLNISSLLALNK